ncbi:1-acyl-sn-glycerol-3-phosphate acyltransferase [Alcanivorax hongdengensis A-11-3]|uniref:1-acyl-sn-glycerol-3-phosphate acyltransferase n=1 Tax=Alcanivorax hongdengensis A-11-3 TaxID=1177179 RepID=L0WCP9_9GAMM|nr:1-acyl-sn-glycerol-3-phosphate acyltransferase [Alcanivorax hongdengensis]EKF73520.1 1-acyl-sn-glycerol-3-phosphate acyltransferase [Alcanivorax hongdengensis A-11-3]
MARHDTFPVPTTNGQRLSQFLLRRAGWTVTPFPEVDKAVIAGGPHTSNWDGALGLTTKVAIDLDAHIMIKDDLFKGPLGWLLRKLGAIAIDRSRSAGVVEQTVEQFDQHDSFYVVVAPEGTRTQASQWKTGFYHMAHQAGVPIVAAVADYRKKQVMFPLVLHPTGDLEQDLQRLYECFASVTPCHPDKLSAPVKAIWDQRQ